MNKITHSTIVENHTEGTEHQNPEGAHVVRIKEIAKKYDKGEISSEDFESGLLELEVGTLETNPSLCKAETMSTKSLLKAFIGAAIRAHEKANGAARQPRV